VALVAVVALAYLPSLGGGFLSWDDPWLVERNALLATHDASTLARIWTDLSEPTRVALGAEYLPVRDTVVWIETAAFGVSAPALRVANLLFYLVGVLLMRVYLIRALGARVGEAAAWLFALHPAHAESAAWIAGHKDTLALVFVAGALISYARGGRAALAAVPLLAIAHLCKAVSVVGVMLFLAHDGLVRRRPDWRALVPSAVLALGAVVLHATVGSVVGMQGEARGLAAVGGIWPRYLVMVGWPPWLSILHDVPPPALWGHALVLALGGMAAALWRRTRLPLFAWVWFVVPLLPVSGIFFSLQNVLADRYLLFSLLAPCLLVAALPIPRVGATVLALVLGITTANRATLFAADVPLWEDAARKTRKSPVAPFKLGTSYEAAGRPEDALRSYREAVRRDPRGETGRSATNNLANLHARRGNLAEAESTYRAARRTWPDDPKLLGNLAEVVARQGRLDEARRLFNELLRRFPDYEPGRRNYEVWFGHR